MPPTTAHQPDRIVTHNKLLHYFTMTYSTSVFCLFIIFQPPICSSTGAFDTDGYSSDPPCNKQGLSCVEGLHSHLL